MITVEDWVPVTKNPKILFVTENCPDFNTYFYRSLEIDKNPISGNYSGANNLLNNLCRVLNIEGDNESSKLNIFLINHFLIDTYVHGTKWSKHTPQHPIENIYKDLCEIDPEHIIFTCKRSNLNVVMQLLQYEKGKSFESPKFSDKILLNAKNEQYVFNSPSDRAFKGFQEQIKPVLENFY